MALVLGFSFSFIIVFFLYALVANISRSLINGLVLLGFSFPAEFLDHVVELSVSTIYSLSFLNGLFFFFNFLL